MNQHNWTPAYLPPQVGDGEPTINPHLLDKIFVDEFLAADSPQFLPQEQMDTFESTFSQTTMAAPIFLPPTIAQAPLPFTRTPASLPPTVAQPSRYASLPPARARTQFPPATAQASLPPTTNQPQPMSLDDMERRYSNRCIELPAGIEYGAKELMIFFPDCMEIRDVLIRFIRNGITAAMFAKVALQAKGTLNWRTFQGLTFLIQKRMDNLQAQFSGPIPAAGPYNEMTSAYWAVPRSYVIPREFALLIRLASMKLAPEAWPQGDDRGLLTMCLEKVRDGLVESRTLDITHILCRIELEKPDEIENLRHRYPRGGRNWDQEFVRNFNIPDPEIEEDFSPEWLPPVM